MPLCCRAEVLSLNRNCPTLVVPMGVVSSFSVIFVAKELLASLTAKNASLPAIDFTARNLF